MSDCFKNDEYRKEHINKNLEDDIWIDEYKKYFENKGKNKRGRICVVTFIRS